MRKNKIDITVVIPTYNEENNIRDCLESLINQTFPLERSEIIVVDGGSTDKTVEIVNKYRDRFPNFKLIMNKRKIVPVAFNLGIKHSSGEYILFMSAHSYLSKNYLEDCYKYAKKHNAKCAGGIEIIQPGNDKLISKCIALIIGNPLENKGLDYRENFSQPRWVRFVALECYHRSVFDKVGLYNENLVRNQDLEFNLRFLESGGKSLLVPSAINYYKTRSSMKAFLKQQFKNGFWITFGLAFSKRTFLLRHLIPLMFVTSLIALTIMSFMNKIFIYLLLTEIILYLSYIVVSSFKLMSIASPKGFTERSKYFVTIALLLILFHLSYGIGSIIGILKYAKIKALGKVWKR